LKNSITSTYKKHIIMAKSGPKDRKLVSSSQDWEISHVAQKMGVSTQQVVGAKRSTGSNDRKTIEDYIAGKQQKSKK
jgi:hypothetical protein